MLKIKSMSLPDGFLARHKCGDIFVETGAYLGGGLNSAADAGFTEFHSVEGNFNRWHQLVTGDLTGKISIPTGAHIYLGDSRHKLAQVLDEIKAPCTIFLDAHERGAPSPLAEELKAVLDFKFPHVLIIDDMFRYRDGTWLPDQSEITRQLWNVGYFDINFAPNLHHPDNLLIALKT